MTRHSAIQTPERTPVKVPLVTRPLGIWGSLQATRRNVLSIIPEVATRQPILSGKTGKRWHMVMDPGAIRRVLLENLDNYPKSLVTKNLLKPAIGESLFIAEGAGLALAAADRGAGVFPPQCDEPRAGDVGGGGALGGAHPRCRAARGGFPRRDGHGDLRCDLGCDVFRRRSL